MASAMFATASSWEMQEAYLIECLKRDLELIINSLVAGYLKQLRLWTVLRFQHGIPIPMEVKILNTHLQQNWKWFWILTSHWQLNPGNHMID